MNKFNSTQKIGNIATEFPKSKDLFKEYRIDFCCGGERPLIEAIEEQHLDEVEVVGKLNSLYEAFANEQDSEKNWQAAPLSSLTEHIVNTHHAYLWSELPKISRLSTTILRVHGGSHPELSRVHKLFHTLKMELELHLSKEEELQYPAIKKFETSGSSHDLKEAVRVIRELQDEHTGAGNILKELRTITNDFTAPEDGCETYEMTYKKLEELESDVFQHIHLESNILFPRLFELEEKATQ
ncbi:MAG: iron-sulfur cluster repair di-iron protein [Sedimentibacter sp.]|uniref:iron-sulfur cluster repair di-iron protein n=1 Tax=Sedimentibacter sp. TaxID=1960295 RepID=UPI0031580220